MFIPRPADLVEKHRNMVKTFHSTLERVVPKRFPPSSPKLCQPAFNKGSRYPRTLAALTYGDWHLLCKNIFCVSADPPNMLAYKNQSRFDADAVL